MPSLSTRLKLLDACDAASAEAVLSGAFPYAEPDEIVPLTRAAIAAARPPLLAQTLGHLHRGGDAALDLLARDDACPTTLLDRAIAIAGRRPDTRTAQTIVEVIDRRRDPALAAHLAGLVSSEVDSLPAAAAQVLLSLAEDAFGSTGRRCPPADVARRLDASVAAAARSWREHRQEDVLLAVALLATRPGPALATLLDEEDHPIRIALRGVPERQETRIVRTNLVRWLRPGPLAGPAARWLHGLERRAYAEAFADAHLVLAPARRRAVRQAVRPRQCLPDLDVAISLPPRAQLAAPELAARLDLAARTRRQYLADLIGLPAPAARGRAVRALCGQQGVDAAAAVEPFCRDRDRGVAHLAAQELERRRPGPSLELLEMLERCLHPAIARRARARRSEHDHDSFRSRWHRLAPPRRFAVARGFLARDRDAFCGFLGVVLRGSDDPSPAASPGPLDDRLVAVALVRRLRLVPELEGDLVRLAASANVRLASVAVSALAAGRTRERFPALVAALGHRNDRVRANAIESLARTTGDEGDGRVALVETIAPATASSDNRCRANAVRAVLAADRARGTAALRRMLRDTSPLHRISGIWVARRSRLIDVRSDLETLAERDRRHLVRRRARSALRLLSPAARGREGAPS